MNTPPLPKWFNAEVSKASKLLLEQALDIYDPQIDGSCKANYRKSDYPLHPIELKFSSMDVYQLMKVAYGDILQKTFLPDIGVTVPEIDENLQLWLECRKKQWKLARLKRKKRSASEIKLPMNNPGQALKDPMISQSSALKQTPEQSTHSGKSVHEHKVKTEEETERKMGDPSKPMETPQGKKVSNAQDDKKKLPTSNILNETTMIAEQKEAESKETPQGWSQSEVQVGQQKQYYTSNQQNSSGWIEEDETYEQGMQVTL